MVNSTKRVVSVATFTYDWKFSQIPRVVHLYWGRNRPLSFLRFATLLTLKKFNPGVQIIVHYPKQTTVEESWTTHEHTKFSYNGFDYFEIIEEMGFKTKELDLEKIGIAYLPEVCKSDLIRYWLMATYGGFWCDFDVIFVRPITKMHLPVALDYERLKFCISGVLMPKSTSPRRSLNAFICSTPGGSYYKSLFDYGIERQSHTDMDYQKYGVLLMDEFSIKHNIPMNEHVIDFNGEYGYILPYKTIVPIESWNLKTIYEQNNFPEDNYIGVHWFAGHPLSSEWEAKITEDNYLAYRHKFLFWNMTRGLA